MYQATKKPNEKVTGLDQQMVQVEESLKSSLATQLTPTGRVAGGSTYKAAIEAMAGATEMLSEIELHREKYTQLLQEITLVEQMIEDEEGDLADAEEAINALVGSEVDLTGMDTKIATIQGHIDTKEQEIVAATAIVETLKRIEGENSKLQAELDGLTLESRVG